MPKKRPRCIIYTRHPECEHNIDSDGALRRGIENRISPLTAVGVLQSEITAKYLRERSAEVIEAAFCSSYLRTHAIPILARMAGMLTITSLLDERNMGVWHKHPRAKVLEMYPGEEDRLKEIGYYSYRAPDGESCADVESRLGAFLESEEFSAAGDTVYISGHGISGLSLRRLLTGASVEELHTWDRLKNGSVSEFVLVGDTYECVMYNHAPWEGNIDPELLKRKSVEA